MLRYLHPHSARRCLITAAAVMVLATIAGNILVDHCPISARFPEADLTLKSWRAHTSAPEVVFIGSSRTGYATSVETMAPRVRQISGDASVQLFNAAVPVGDPLTMNFLGAHLFTGGRMSKLAVIEITPDSVARRNRFLDFVVTRQFTFRDVLENSGDICHSTNKTISRTLSSRFIPFFTHRLALQTWAREAFTGPEKSHTVSEQDDEFFRGFWGSATLPKELPGPPPALRTEQDLPRVRKQLADYEIPGHTSAALEALVARCHRDGMRIVLLETPMHSSLRALFGPSITGPYLKFVKHLEDTYGCRFVNFSERVPDTMFFDGVHTNGEGREQFSQLFADEILGPMWRDGKRSHHE